MEEKQSDDSDVVSWNFCFGFLLPCLLSGIYDISQVGTRVALGVKRRAARFDTRQLQIDLLERNQRVLIARES